MGLFLALGEQCMLLTKRRQGQNVGRLGSGEHAAAAEQRRRTCFGHLAMKYLEREDEEGVPNAQWER
jgi:hypothetical protein